MADAPYLKENRLSDVIAAIQFMAMHERSRRSAKEWAEGIGADGSKASRWKEVFEEHPELFRKAPDGKDEYALIWRRSLPKRYFRHENKLLTQKEYEALSDDERRWVSRPPLTDDQVKTLVEIAVTLHGHQQDASRDWRWMVPVVASFAGSIVGTVLTLLGIALAIIAIPGLKTLF
jgi:hypothetical protein